MKVAILAGGLGSRLAEETEIKPKPMVEIGGMPILWHIMMHYSRYGYHNFAVALGYKGEYIKRYMMDLCTIQSDLTVKTRTGDVLRHTNGRQARLDRRPRGHWHQDPDRRPNQASGAITSATALLC